MKNYLYFKKSVIVFSSIFLLGQSSCAKKEDAQPVADFTSDKTEYLEGETIQLSNTSANAGTVKWTLPDGQTSVNENIAYPLETFSTDRVLQFRLDANSKSGTKSDFIVKNIRVKARTGQLVLYEGYYTGSSTTIYIDGLLKGTVVLPGGTYPLPAVIPVCGQSGYPTYTLKTGTHSIIADGVLYRTKNFEIKHGECTVLHVYN